MFHGGLVGKDDACIHADNSMTPCRNRQHRPWCQKHWHHNCATASASHAPTSTLNRKLESLQLSVWPHVSFAAAGVHDCRGKCMRGDDFTQNLSMHHNVIFNCGEGPVGTDGDGQSFGVVLKGAFGQAIDLQRCAGGLTAARHAIHFRRSQRVLREHRAQDAPGGRRAADRSRGPQPRDGHRNPHDDCRGSGLHSSSSASNGRADR